VRLFSEPKNQPHPTIYKAFRTLERGETRTGELYFIFGAEKSIGKDAEISSPMGTCFTEENMGMLNDYELTASCLAGGLGGTRKRLDRTMGRLYSIRPQDAQDNPEPVRPGCRSPSYAAAISQALSDLTDAWQGLLPRPAKFRETERLFLLLKDKTLETLASNPALWSDYHRLAQCLNELTLDYGQMKPEIRL
jgi:hypothetical protein